MVLLIAWIGGLLYRWRSEILDRAEPGPQSDREEITAQFNLHVRPDRTRVETAASKALGVAWRSQLHEPAIRLKAKYYELIGRCGFLLSFVFLLLALELTVLRTRNALQPYFVSIDFCAIGLVLIFWWRAIVTNHRWVRKRTNSELLRQWLYLTFVFLWPENERAREFDDTLRYIDSPTDQEFVNLVGLTAIYPQRSLSAVSALTGMLSVKNFAFVFR